MPCVFIRNKYDAGVEKSTKMTQKMRTCDFISFFNYYKQSFIGEIKLNIDNVSVFKRDSYLYMPQKFK